MQKLLLASLTALLLLAPSALAETTNIGPGMNTPSNTSTGVGSSGGATTTNNTPKKSNKFKIFNRLHRQKQIRQHRINRRLMKYHAWMRHGRIR